MAIEIAVQDPAGARVAARAGADRVELCTALGIGGLTPSTAAVELCAAQGIDVHVLIRSRGGGFVFTAEEVELMCREAAQCVRAGAAGVVIGALLPDNTLDLPALERMAAAARAEDSGVAITLHRAADVALAAQSHSPGQIVSACAGLGFARILTSGGAPASGQGLEVLGQLALAGAQVGVEIQAGGGVKIQDFPALAAAGVPSAHLSCRAVRADAGSAGPGGGPASFDYTDPELVEAAVAAATAAGLTAARA